MFFLFEGFPGVSWQPTVSFIYISQLILQTIGCLIFDTDTHLDYDLLFVRDRLRNVTEQLPGFAEKQLT